MVNERSSSFYVKISRKETGFAPKPLGSLAKQLEFGRISSQLKQTGGGSTQLSAMATKMPKVVAKGNRRTASLNEVTSKNATHFSPITTMSFHTPRKAKVSFPPPSRQVVQQRRMSVPQESLSMIPKSILKKRHSVSVESEAPAPHNDQIDMSILCNLPWERELYLPPISRNGTLVFLEEDGSLPPMLRRLSNADTYNYSQEFLTALDDLKNRPSSTQYCGNAATHR